MTTALIRAASKLINYQQVPIQKSLVDMKLLSERERQWLLQHNESVKKTMLPLLQNDKRAMRWLKRQ